MIEGRAKLEESAIIVQEVAKEIKDKEQKLMQIETKLIQSLFVMSG